jgi:hypothetical protein
MAQPICVGVQDRQQTALEARLGENPTSTPSTAPTDGSVSMKTSDDTEERPFNLITIGDKAGQ